VSSPATTRSAFTLLELLVVIVIIAILASPLSYDLEGEAQENMPEKTDPCSTFSSMVANPVARTARVAELQTAQGAPMVQGSWTSASLCSR